MHGGDCRCQPQRWTAIAFLFLIFHPFNNLSGFPIPEDTFHSAIGHAFALERSISLISLRLGGLGIGGFGSAAPLLKFNRFPLFRFGGFIAGIDDGVDDVTVIEGFQRKKYVSYFDPSKRTLPEEKSDDGG